MGKSILFNWSVVGWCVGVIKERNMDARSYRKIDDERVKVNFLIYYAIDDNVVPTVLRCALRSTEGRRRVRGLCWRWR